jgi:hypothetical protein
MLSGSFGQWAQSSISRPSTAWMLRFRFRRVSRQCQLFPLLIRFAPNAAGLGAAQGIELRRPWCVVIRLVVSFFWHAM